MTHSTTDQWAACDDQGGQSEASIKSIDQSEASS